MLWFVTKYALRQIWSELGSLVYILGLLAGLIFGGRALYRLAGAFFTQPRVDYLLSVLCIVAVAVWAVVMVFLGVRALVRVVREGLERWEYVR